MQQLADCGITSFITPKIVMARNAKRLKNPELQTGNYCDPLPLQFASF
jgi:hypothetical protein